MDRIPYFCVLKPKNLAIVKLLCRYAKDATDKRSKEIEEELNLQELMQGDKFDRGLEREKLVKDLGAFDYGPFHLNLKDVCTANHVDEEHTCIRLYNGTAYTFKIPFDFFEAMYQTMLGILVTDYTTIEKIKKDHDDDITEK